MDVFPLDLPSDVWRLISGILQSDSLGQVCQMLRKLLGRRYIKVRAITGKQTRALRRFLPHLQRLVIERLIGNAALVSSVVRPLVAAPHLKELTLHFVGKGVEDDAVHELAHLKNVPAMQSLHIFLEAKRVGSNTVADPGAQALAQLRDAPALQTLTLSLSGTDVGPTGATALAALKTARTLHSLKIYLDNSDAGDEGAAAFEGLKEAKALHTLHLSFGSSGQDGNVPGDRAAIALGALKAAPVLHTLILDLSSSQVGDAGASGLSALKEARTLHHLEIDLSNTLVGDVGAAELAKLRDAPALQHLALNLNLARVGPPGACALSRLNEAAGLQTIHLQLSQSDEDTVTSLNDNVARALATLANAPALTDLKLELGCSQFTYEGLQALETLNFASSLQALTLDIGGGLAPFEAADSSALVVAALRDAPSLRTLTLMAESCGYTDLAALALAMLRHSQTLQTLHINVHNNEIGDTGAQALWELRHAPALRTLTLDFGRNPVTPGALATLRHTLAGLQTVTILPE